MCQVFLSQSGRLCTTFQFHGALTHQPFLFRTASNWPFYLAVVWLVRPSNFKIGRPEAPDHWEIERSQRLELIPEVSDLSSCFVANNGHIPLTIIKYYSILFRWEPAHSNFHPYPMSFEAMDENKGFLVPCFRGLSIWARCRSMPEHAAACGIRLFRKSLQ